MRNHTVSDVRNAFGSIVGTVFIIAAAITFTVSWQNPVALFSDAVKNYLNVTGLLMLYGATAVVLIIDLLALGWHDSSVRRLISPNVSARIDLLSFLIFSHLRLGWIFFHVVTFGLFALVGTMVGDWTGSPRALQYIENPLLQFLASMVARDFFVYWTHRFQHRVEWLWHQHTLHHSATQFNVVTVHRVNPLEEQFGSAISGFWLALLGTPIETYLLIIFMSQCQQLLIHSGVKWDFGWFGRWIYVSPAYHRIHHSAEPCHFDRNFSTQLVIWDRMFGTYYVGDKQAIRLGLDDPAHNQGFLLDLGRTTFYSLKLFLQGLIFAASMIPTLVRAIISFIVGIRSRMRH